MAVKVIAENRKARHEYHLLERYEAGIVLTGTEVKSLRGGGASLQQAYADIRNGEAWLIGAHIAEYGQGNLNNHDPDRDRKLLLHGKEIASLAQLTQQDPQKLATRLNQTGQINEIAGDIIRSKALDLVVEHADITPEEAA